jgi:hypothetical protein
VHVDAAFGGFTVPFVAAGENREIGFQHPAVMSVALDGDKMGQLPYPAGVFLCRKGLQDLITMPVNYVRGGHDDTLSGSRSALAPVLAYFLYRKEGRVGQARYVRRCIEARNRLAANLEERFAGSQIVEVLPRNPYVNQLAAVVRLDGRDGIRRELLEGPDKEPLFAPYELRSDLLPENPLDVNSCPWSILKICVMPHTIPYLERFVDDFAKGIEKHRR